MLDYSLQMNYSLIVLKHLSICLSQSIYNRSTKYNPGGRWNFFQVCMCLWSLQMTKKPYWKTSAEFSDCPGSMQAKKLPPLVCPSLSIGTELFPASTELTECPVINFIKTGSQTEICSVWWKCNAYVKIK